VVVFAANRDFTRRSWSPRLRAAFRRCGAGSFLDDIIAPWGQRTSNPRLAIVGECRDATARCPAAAMGDESQRRSQWISSALGNPIAGTGAGIGSILTAGVSLGGGSRSITSYADMESILTRGRLTNGWFDALHGTTMEQRHSNESTDLDHDADRPGLDWEL